MEGTAVSCVCEGQDCSNSKRNISEYVGFVKVRLVYKLIVLTNFRFSPPLIKGFSDIGGNGSGTG